MLSLFLIAFILIISRRIDIILNPQFWAEDGVVWYQQAYNLGILKTFFVAQSGYLQKGEKIKIPIQPKGWEMTLIKK